MATVESLVPKVATYLVTAARQHRTVTYGDVARAVDTHPRVVPKTLEVIRAACIEQGWPALTSIVVSATTRKPGEAFLDPWVSRDTVAAAKDAMTQTMQDDVFTCDWAPLLARFGVSAALAGDYLPIGVNLQIQFRYGGIMVTAPGLRTRIDERHGPLYAHLRQLLVQAGQWPEERK
jgi:hypothetical protein